MPMAAPAWYSRQPRVFPVVSSFTPTSKAAQVAKHVASSLYCWLAAVQFAMMAVQYAAHVGIAPPPPAPPPPPVVPPVVVPPVVVPPGVPVVAAVPVVVPPVVVSAVVSSPQPTATMQVTAKSPPR